MVANLAARYAAEAQAETRPQSQPVPVAKGDYRAQAQLDYKIPQEIGSVPHTAGSTKSESIRSK